MRVPFLEWFRDGDGWTTPDGRRGELVAIAVTLPVFVFSATHEIGVPSPAESPLAVIGGVCCGLFYAVYVRHRLPSSVPEAVRNVAVSFVLGGGVGLSLLRIVDLAAPTVLFVVATCVTIAAIYVAWLVSPLEDGLRPPRRGAEPPAPESAASDD